MVVWDVVAVEVIDVVTVVESHRILGWGHSVVPRINELQTRVVGS